MDVKAIVVLTSPMGADGSMAETFAGHRLAALDVLGEPPAVRIVQRLRRYGISDCVVVCDPCEFENLRSVKTISSDNAPWKAAEGVFNEFVDKAADVVLILRVGPYAEIDFDELIQFHLAHSGRLTCTFDSSGRSLDVFAVNTSRRNDAAFLFRHGLQAVRSPAEKFVFAGYVNWLVRAVDLRQLAVDAFLRRNDIQPAGAEIRPGIWIGEGARVHPRARLVAPAYIGAHARVRAAAVVTRFSSVEHHAEIDCGTVIENSTVAPRMYVGAGLDISWSVIGLGQTVANLRRNLEVEIADPKLISALPSNAPLRALGEAASLTAFLPIQLFRGLFARSRRPVPSGYPAEGKIGPSIPVESAFNPPGDGPGSQDFPSNLAVARRYGNE